MNPNLNVLRAIRGGVFTRADARACGYSDPDIDSLLSTGGWRRIRPGRYAAFRDLTLVTDETLHVRRTFQLLRESSGRTASHQSAAALHGLPLWGLDLSKVHLTLEEVPEVLRGRGVGGVDRTPRDRAAAVGRAGRGAGTRRAGRGTDARRSVEDDVVRHVRSPLGPGVVVWNGLRVTSPPRTVAEVAATCPPAPAQAVADASLYTGLATPTALRKATDHLTEGVEQARSVVARATPDSASVAESRLRVILADAGLPTPSSSPPPGVDADQVGCSLWFPAERTVVEFEPHRPYWSNAPDETTIPALAAYLAEAADRAFGVPRPGLPADPSPAGYCWISWPDLDDPPAVVEEIRTTFARALRSTAVRPFDPTRRRHVNRGRIPRPS
ncbi:type IV toxin-antitoxin system AbiEi family antitoxin domain-containing protein [Kribbella sp. DT2]|uniref:type IV toxin-antitoxin system AbiEi family antitoxin domain-containing protein n=1 Tax=Kribbella sp. DT2 TaxID=3393427 RepID=UPI003CFAA813